MSVSSRGFVQSRLKNISLLAPQCKDVITKSENNILKEALFVFLATIDRKV